MPADIRSFFGGPKIQKKDGKEEKVSRREFLMYDINIGYFFFGAHNKLLTLFELQKTAGSKRKMSEELYLLIDFRDS